MVKDPFLRTKEEESGIFSFRLTLKDSWLRQIYLGSKVFKYLQLWPSVSWLLCLSRLHYLVMY